MNKLYLVIIFFCTSVPCFAQFSDVQLDSLRGVSIGIEKNENLFADYGFKNEIHIGVKHSVMPEDETNQTLQLNASYTAHPYCLDVKVNPFITTGWKLDYTSVGCRLQVTNSKWAEYVQLGASIIPYYDTDLKYRTCWETGVSVRLCNDIRVFAEISDKPQYRIAYKRVCLGFDFRVENLQVKPSLQIPIYDSGMRLRHSNICISAAYTFKINN